MQRSAVALGWKLAACTLSLQPNNDEITTYYRVPATVLHGRAEAERFRSRAFNWTVNLVVLSEFKARLES